MSTSGVANVLGEIGVISFHADHQLAGVSNGGANNVSVDELERGISIFKQSNLVIQERRGLALVLGAKFDVKHAVRSCAGGSSKNAAIGTSGSAASISTLVGTIRGQHIRCAAVSKRRTGDRGPVV